MNRCLALAQLGASYVAPNPMVGAVLVYENRIIGEGYHKQYGSAHAEVNCIDSVKAEDQQLIPLSTIYVSLEPCAHFGKTPPCAHLIIKKGIKKVVIGCSDPFEAVNGKGITILQEAGVSVISKVLEKECMLLNKRFFTFHALHRPYIMLKWAQSNDGFIAGKTKERTQISNEYTNRLVHQWRSEESAILVGSNTALADNPSLNNRLWSGKHPTRMYIDKNLSLPASHHLNDCSIPTIIFNTLKEEMKENKLYVKYGVSDNVIDVILNSCYKLGLQSILVEGGTTLLQSFIDENKWDEARVIQNNHLFLMDGIKAPILSTSIISDSTKILNDTIHYFNKP